MSRLFDVGDLAILVNGEFHPEYDGSPVRIVGAFGVYEALNPETMQEERVTGYRVRLLAAPDCLLGKDLCILARRHQLRRPADGGELETDTATADQQRPVEESG